ncbi:Alpha/Beta hydrolase protein [Gilbertella persicaria]|uniref:Alpha/Beta hydrolase protein n=1 Tax=Gilbertella persicaria TaxID=101096 RepID=UPI0022206DE9|nr:Alpha/Beta hydrolase protein [Gilbertella persicaria]KAI8094838.1 Alpha/Beta hydrolase protein [Gilbertella persicaria]
MHLCMQINGVTEFYVNGKRYSGDCYGYNTTSHIIYFEKGKHHIDVRIVHDVRVFGGGKTPPACQFKVYLDPRNETLVYPDDCAVILPSLATPSRQSACELLMPDYLVDIGFAGSYGSVSLQNAGDDQIKLESITLCIVDEQTLTKHGLFIEYKTELLAEEIYILPGQTRPVSFRFRKEGGSLPSTSILKFWVRIGLVMDDQAFAIRATSHVQCVDWMKTTFKYTFLDYDGVVQYAMAKRPLALNADQNKPLIVALHGAGVEADSRFWTDSIPAQKSSWILFPTGRTPWGYDWHGPSTKNVFKAIDGLIEIQDLLPPHFECMESAAGEDWVDVSMPYEVLKTLKSEDSREWVIGNKDRLIMMGHSNGGQGVWHFAVHFPDKIIGVVPAAGYTKIQDYVSFHHWIGDSFSDPILRGILEASIAEYNNDLHLANMADLSVLPRVGTEDDNVPPLHTRKYVRILNGLLKRPTAIKVLEAIGQGHWFDSVFSDKSVQDFLKTTTTKNESNEFCVTLVNPAGIGSVHGIQVQQMAVPYRLGKIYGTRTTNGNKTRVTLKTTNIASFRLTKHFKGCHTLIVDGDVFSNLESQRGFCFALDIKNSKRWKLDNVKIGERNIAHYGPIHRMYESCHPLVIVIPNHEVYRHAALQIAHDWLLYGRGDTMILYDDQHPPASQYTLYLGLPNENKAMSRVLESPFDISLQVNNGTTRIQVGDHTYDSPGTGILFMRPIQDNQMAVIISGVDLIGFDSAWRLLPKRTGMMIPEWIITSKEMKSIGIGGVLSAG